MKKELWFQKILYIKKSDDEEFFVYLDYDKDSVYFLWNHAFPDPVFYDTELKRASEIFNDEYNKKRQQEVEMMKWNSQYSFSA